MIDWAANFAEAYLDHSTDTSYLFANGATSVSTVGLNPMVTALMTTYDGGKLMSGFGLFDNTTHFGWVIKLFGTSSESAALMKCATWDKPVNYTTMVTTVSRV
jgi:hypothetical protein